MIEATEQIQDILKNIPLRIAITDYCNLNCFFCSNEGMALNLRNTSKAELENLLTLLKLLKTKGLEHVSITGGDPTCYPQLEVLLKEINHLNFKKTFFHTNGIALNKKLILGELKKFSKIAISIHSLQFENWKKMTSGTRGQFNNLLENLKLISKNNYGNRVEIKVVCIKGISDSTESIKSILDFCNKNNFRFKFLIFEPIKKEHLSLVVPLREILEKLEYLGAKRLMSDISFRNQQQYLPIQRLKYGSTEGVLIEIGCGKKEVCRACFKSNEIFITPNLEIKPCHISSGCFNLKDSLINHDSSAILKSILESRLFLSRIPGVNKKYWTDQ